MKEKPPLKRYIVRKFIMAHSAQEALNKEHKHRPDEVWVDSDWAKENSNSLVSAIGFDSPQYEDD